MAPDEALYKKIAFRLIPFMMLLYLVAFLDRVNISFAALTMNADLGLSPAVYGWGPASSSSAISCSRCPATWCWSGSAPAYGSPASW
jgi:hypothetical protein